MALAIALRTTATHSMVTLAGELDVLTAGPVQAFLIAEIDDCTRDMVVDLRRVTFMGAAGLTALVAASAALEADSRQISIVCDSPAIQRLFIMTGLHETLNVHSATVDA